MVSGVAEKTETSVELIPCAVYSEKKEVVSIKD